LKRITTLFLVLCVLSTGTVFAAGISVGKATRGYTATLDIDCPKVDMKAVQVLGKKAIALSAKSATLASDKDAPELPRYTAMVMVDPVRKPVFQVKSLSSEIINLDAPVVPSKGNFKRNINPADVPYNYGAVYSKNAWYPSDKDLVAMGEPYIFREVRGVNLIVNPIQYNPVKNQIKVHTKLQVTVKAGDVDKKNVMKKAQPISKAFEPIYKNTFVNYREATTRLPRLDELGRLLIITADEYAAAMKPFVEWKQKLGLTVKMVPMSAVGTTNTDVYNFIQEEYKEGGLTNIMLVGDADKIPTNKGVRERADSDTCYVKLAGDDHVPDAIISRLSAADEAGVAYQVAKFINYERFPTTDKSWYTRLLGIGSAEGRPADYVYIDEIRSTLMDKGLFKDAVKAYDPGANAGMVTEAVNKGVSLINYLGHGSGTSWGTTRFSNSNMPSLKNGWQMPIIWDIACVNGRFVNFTGFGEAWLRAGNIEAPAGAVAYAGASTNMEWVPPIHMQAEINKVLIANQSYKTVGGLHMNGLIKGLELYTAEPYKSGVMMLEQWNLFGDSTMLVRFKAPVAVKAVAKGLRSDDGTTVKIDVKQNGKAVSNARVTVYTKGAKNLVIGTTNDQGQAAVTLPKSVKDGYITVVGCDIVPIVDQPIEF
jgi:gingipain R